MKGNPASGFEVGNAAAINVSLGWIPDVVIVTNITDGDIITIGFLTPQTMAFTSGGVTEVTAGAKIKGATSGAIARVTDVMLASGTWAAGSAAGFFVIEVISGTFQSEAVYIISDTTAGVDDASGAVQSSQSVAITTAVATVTTTSAILPYAGVPGSASRGFTIGSVVAEEAMGLRWIAFRTDQYVNSVS